MADGDNALAVGSRVRFYCPGSIRHLAVGRIIDTYVKYNDKKMAFVRFDDPQFQSVEVFLPGIEMMHLEAINDSN